MALNILGYLCLHWSNVFPPFYFPGFESVQMIRIISSKITFVVPFLAIHNYFLLFADHLNNSFEPILNCILGVAHYFIDYQTAKTRSKDTYNI